MGLTTDGTGDEKISPEGRKEPDTFMYSKDDQNGDEGGEENEGRGSGEEEEGEGEEEGESSDDDDESIVVRMRAAMRRK